MDANEKIKYQVYEAQLKVKIKEVIEKTCEQEGIELVYLANKVSLPTMKYCLLTWQLAVYS